MKAPVQKNAILQSSGNLVKTETYKDLTIWLLTIAEV
jgi:hypothetical protein